MSVLDRLAEIAAEDPWFEDEVIAARNALPALLQVAQAVEHLLGDVSEVGRIDLRLHDLQQRIGALFLGFGGGFNHEDDLRAALAALEASE